MTLQHRFVIVSLAIVGLSTAANAQKIVSAVGGTINSGGPGSGALALSYNQAGLLTNYVSDVTDFNSYIATKPLHKWAFTGNEWFGEFGTTSAVVTYDLGSVRGIDALALWNEDASGIGKLNLLGSIDGASFFSLSAGLSPIDNPVNADYTAQVFAFGAASLRYFRMDMSACPQSQDAFMACAIGEVAFRTANATIPEPSTYALMFAGLAALGVAARRRRSA